MRPEEKTISMGDDVVAEWREPRLPAAFASHHNYMVESQKATTVALIGAAGIGPGDEVVDIGCGSGIPSLTLAEVVGPSGHVTAVDPSPVFVVATKENARKLGLTNITVVEAAAASLPFAGGSFDAATCLFAVMFFPNVDAGLRRIRGVLRPGGRAAFVAWGPSEENSLFGAFWSAAGPYAPPGPPPDPSVDPSDIPQPARFAEPGSLSRVLKHAEFEDVREDSRVVDVIWPGAAETNFAFWLEITDIEARVAPEQRDAFRSDVLASLRRFERDGALHFSARVVVASGSA